MNGKFQVMKVDRCLFCSSRDLSVVTYRLDGVNILRCDRCRLMMVDRLANKTEDLYKKDYFEKAEKTNSGYSTYLSMPAANMIGKYAFARLITDKVGSHLDLGCANGSLVDIFSSYGYRSHGLEISQDAVDICLTKGLDVRQSDLHHFPEDFKEFDIVTAYDVLEHVDAPGIVLRNIASAMNGKGVFVFTTLAVTKYEPTDYWFNNSLEHYIYYDNESLNNVLTQTFGEGNYYFNQVSINGVSEFWGFAQNTRISNDNKIKKYIEENYAPDNVDDAYLLSLYLNQISRFDRSKKIIDQWAFQLAREKRVYAIYYNLYSQGRFEKALEEIEKNENSILSSTPLLWHSVYDAKRQLSEIEKFIIRKEGSEQIVELRDKLFAINNSRAYKIAILIQRLMHVAKFIPRLLKKNAQRSIFLLKKILRFIKKQTILIVKKSELKVLIPRFVGRFVKKYIDSSSIVDDSKQYTLVNAGAWTDRPLISVIIPFYKRADTIDATLESLRSQTFSNFEVILVDDGSPDNVSKLKIEELKKDKLINRLIVKANQGVAIARNTGVEAASGKYIVCLDSDDLLEPTYLEKCVLILETHPDVSIVTTYMTMFGVDKEQFYRESPHSPVLLSINDKIIYSLDGIDGEKVYKHSEYSPLSLYEDNMIITASMFRRDAWKKVGGYKQDIGYEDWEYWINLHEHGYRAVQLKEPLFRYRVALNSRYTEDKGLHKHNVETIHSLHKDYIKIVKEQNRLRNMHETVVESSGSLINLASTNAYAPNREITKKQILITIPWMTFGGAETLIRNFAGSITDEYNIGFITGIKCDHEWEYKFREITPDIYHLPNLFEEDGQWLEFILNYIKTRKVDVLHLIHNEFTLKYLPEIRKQLPHLKIVITMFNDSVDYFKKVIEASPYIDAYTTDNELVLKAITSSKKYDKSTKVIVIPNGIDTKNIFNQSRQDRDAMRNQLGLRSDDVAVFYIGRISPEKNPQVFLDLVRKAKKKKLLLSHRFFMIGDGSMRKEMFKDYAMELDQDNFTYLGYQSDIPAYLAAADIFVLPSKIEGFPLSVLEAMAMEVIPVCSKVGALPQVITDGKDGFLVKPGDSNDILDTIELIQKNKHMQRIKDEARKTVDHKYTIEKLGQNYKLLYRSLRG